MDVHRVKLQHEVDKTLTEFTKLSDAVRSNPQLPLRVVEQHLQELHAAVMGCFLMDNYERGPRFPVGMPVEIAHDGFKGSVIGYYITREGKAGVVLQHVGSKIVHVYGEKWVVTKNEPDADRT